MLTFVTKSSHIVRKTDSNKPNYFKIDFDELSKDLRNLNWDNAFSETVHVCRGYKFFNEVVKSLISKNTLSSRVKTQFGAVWSNG